MNFRTLISLALITTLIACGGAEERKTVYLEKAKSSIESGDFEKARVELKNVLQIDPKDSEAYYYLGTVFEQQNNYQKAFGNYLKAEELNPDLLANQAKLGRIYLLLANEPEKAQSKIDFILSKDPENADGLLLKATMMLKNKNIDEAMKIATSVINKEPGNVDAAIFIASLYMNAKNNSEAINTLEKAIKANPENEKLNTIYARVLLANKDFDRAEVVFNGLLEKDQDKAENYNNLAAVYDLAGNKSKAEETLRASVDNDSSDADRQITLIRYIRTVKGGDVAINELRNLIAKNNGLGKLRTALGELLYVKGDKDSAITVYKNAAKDFSEEKTGVEARLALATIYISDEDYTKASEILEEAVAVSPNDPKVNYLRAKIALHDNDIEKAIISLRIVTKETPENVDAFLLLANVYQFEKNDEQVRNTLNNAYENNKSNADGLLKLAQYQLARDVEQSEKIIDDFNKLKESDYDGLSIKAAILNQKKEQAEAYKLAEKLMSLYPDKPNGYLQAIPYLNQQGEKQKAISVLEKGYINTKDNRKLLILLSSLQVSEKQFDVAEKRIKAELTSSPDDAELKILLAKVYLVSKDNVSAETLLNEVIDKDNSALEEPYILLAQLYQNNMDLTAARSILAKGKTNVTSSIKIPFKLASLYELDGDYQKAIELYRELYKSYPDNIVVINNFASMLTDHSDNEDDLAIVKILAEKLQKSDQPVFLDTVGWAHYKMGDSKAAIQYLSQVVEKMPEVNVFNYHLGMAYKMAGDKTQAKLYLEKSLSSNKPFAQKSSAEAALKDL